MSLPSRKQLTQESRGHCHVCAHRPSWGGADDCAACHVTWDALSERGVSIPADLLYGLSEHPQSWSLGDIKKIHVDVDDNTDEPNFTWVLEFVGGVVEVVRGWHDYTGWDCQSGLKTENYPSLRAALDSLVDWEREALAKQGRKDVLP